MSEANSSSIDQLISELDIVHINTASRRDKLINKLDKVIDSLEMNANSDDPEKTEVQAKVVDIYLKVLNEQDKAITNRVNVRLKQKDTENNKDVGKVVAKLLSNISLVNVPTSGTGIVNTEEDFKKLDDICDKSGIVIKDTELRDDPNDLSEK